MSFNSAKNITGRIWDTIPMPDTVIAHVNKLACKEPNQFIFKENSDNPIGDIDTTGMDRDADDGPTRPSSQIPSNRRGRG